MEVSEPSGLLLQLLPQRSIVLRGGRSEWHCAQAKAASANTPFTKLLNKTHCRAWKALESEVGLRGRKLVEHIWVWGPTCAQVPSSALPCSAHHGGAGEGCL